MEDLTQALKDAENSLRDFIAATLQEKLGEGWEEKCGVAPQRITQWRDRKVTEEKRLGSGTPEERLLYYADFYDLETILKKHWPHFTEAFGEQRRFLVLLSELEKLRDADAHRRELLPHQQQMGIAVSGEIRTLIARYRSSRETSEAYFPRFESVRDNFGNAWAIGSRSKYIATNHVLRPGDILEFVCTASDPLGEPVEYALVLLLVRSAMRRGIRWQRQNTLVLNIRSEHISQPFRVDVSLRSLRDYHASNGTDDKITFTYTVLPPRT